MAELTPLFMDVSNAYSGDELGLPYRDLVSEGVVAAGDLEVSANSPADLSVDVAAGAAWVLGDTNTTRQPCYRVINDAVVNLGISPDPSNPRKVRIIAQIIDEGFAGTGRVWELQALHGTPAATPTEPALPDSALELALVDVAAGATSIVAGNITDRRTVAGPGPILGGSVDVVTALPGSPSDGDEIIFTDSLTAPTYYWHLRYNGTTTKWHFLGGTPLFAEVATAESTSSTSYAALSTAGPSIALPLAGDYDVEIGAAVRDTATTGAAAIMSYDIGATGAVDADALKMVSVSSVAGRTTAGSFARRKAGLSAVTLTAKYKQAGGTAAEFEKRWMRVTPVKVG